MRAFQFDSDTPFAVPVKPGHRDLTLQLTPDKVPAVENHLTDGDIWVRISTTGGNFKDLRKDRIEFFLRELLAEAKRTAA